jgi:UDP-N-acetylglucosamine acyltransferase
LADHGIFVNGTQICRNAHVDDYVHTSAFIMISPGVRVGAYTFTLPYTDVDRDSPPFVMLQGAPCRVRGINTEKLRRCGFGEGDIRSLKGALREIYDNPDQKADLAAVQKILKDPRTNRHVRLLAEAIKRSVAQAEKGNVQ